MRLLIAPLLLALLWTVALPKQVWADTIYVSRGASTGVGEIGESRLYTWDDQTNIESLIGINTYVGGAFNGQNALIDGLALLPNSNPDVLYAFVLDDVSDAPLVPVTATISGPNFRSQLVVVNTSNGEVTPVNSANWNNGFALLGAAFDPSGRLWAVDASSEQLVEINLATGLVVTGSEVPVGVDVTISVDLAFTANGVGLVGTGGFRFRVFDPVQNTIIPLTDVPTTPVGFDSALTPPYAVAGLAFTTHLAARNLDATAAELCRLNIYEGRGQDQYGHSDDPFITNPIIAHADLNAADPNTGPGDLASDVFPNCLFDFGDAPASYDPGTPAQHGLSPNVKLGTISDAEIAPAPTANADGDDATDTADEDGIHFNTDVSVPGRNETIFVTASDDGYLNAWIDFNRNGTFDASEQIANDEVVPAGVYTLTYTVPTGADFVEGDSYARFRITSAPATATSPTGIAPDGEVEDYTRSLVDAAQIALALCPAGSIPVPTSLIQNPSYESSTQACFTNTANNSINFATNWFDSHPTGGQYHIFSPTCNTGPGPGSGGMPMRAGADGVAFMGGHSATVSGNGYGEGATNTLVSPLTPDATYVGFFSMMTGGYGRESNGYMDFFGVNNLNVGHIAGSGVVAPTAANTEFLYSTPVVPWYGGTGLPTWKFITYTLTADQAWPYLRVEVRDPFPVTGESVAQQTWVNFDDFQMYLCQPQIDWGDAPDSYGTTIANNGARHHSNGNSVYLGASVDIEDDGLPTTNADGDDTDATGDEDALSGLPRLTLAGSPAAVGSTITTTVACAPNGAFVVGYIDLNGEGIFGTGHERSATATCTGGSANLVWTLAAEVTAKNTYMRLRIAENSAEIQTPTGKASSGEVEDYRVILEPPAQATFPLCDARAFLFQDDTNTNGYAVNLVTGIASLVFPTMANETNAIGYNQVDNYIWGSCLDGCPTTGSINNNYLTRVGTGGGNTDFGPIPGLDIEGYHIGDVRPDGLMFLTNAKDRMHVVDLRPTSPTYLTVISDTVLTGFDNNGVAPVNVGGADWAFHPGDGQLYSVANVVTGDVHNARLLRINPETGVITNLGLLRNNANTVNINFGTSTTGWGAVYFDSAGYFYISENGTGRIHRVDITDPSLPNQYRAVLFANGPSSGSNDGARCNNAPLPIDLGDAPDTYGTTFDSDGARHDRSTNTSLFLGAAVDTENDGQPSANADGDDTNGVTPDDEDGVTFNSTIAPGQSVQIPVQVSGNGGRLHAWIDWNRDGDFADAGEKVANNLTVVAGTNNVTVNVPAGALLGTTVARFRLTSQTTMGATGPATDGEVEDHLITVGIPILSSSKSDALLVDADSSSSVSPGDTLRYTILITNSGTGSAINAIYTDTLDINTTLDDGSVTTTQGSVTTGNGSGDSSVVVALGNLLPNTSATIVYDAIIDNPIAAAVTQVSNQGITGVENPDVPDEPTDDPDDPTPDDPTDTPIDALPVIDATKRDSLLVDADSSGTPSPGDTLLYTVTISNSGNKNAPAVLYSDTPDANTTLIVGSVTTSVGTVTTGNSAGNTTVGVNVGTLVGGGGEAIVTYRVTINNPIPAGVIEVSNQGLVTDGDPDTPDEPTDDPDDPDPDDPTDTPISAAPKLEAFKRDALLVDADSSGAPSPGDTLIYTVTIVNSGNQAASNMVYADTPDPNTALIVGSVTTSQGTVTEGNTGGDTTVAVNVGNVAGGGASITIEYQATIDNPVPVGVTEVSNQGIVTVDNPGIPDIPTDDPDDPTPDDPTETPIDAKPRLDSFKKDVLLVDADNSGGASPGDTLQYQVTIINSGNQDAPGVIYTDTPDSNTALINGSVATTVGTVTTGNANGDSQIAINVGTLAGQGGQVLVTYNVTIDNPLPAGVTQVSNQGIVTDDDPRTPDDPTDDPDDPDPEDPTDTLIEAKPKIDSYKRDTLLVDADNNGSPSPGDTLLYNITIINSGNQAATDLDYTDNLDPNTALVVGSVATSAGSITSGNTAGDDSVAVEIPTLAGGGAEVNISYQATIDNPVPAGVTQVSNQGIITSDDPKVPDKPTDDPDDPTPEDPTDTPITAEPVIQSFKSDSLFEDADGNGSPSPGDTLLYNITIINSGNQASLVLTYTDNIDPNLTMVAESVNTDRGTVLDGTDAGDTTIVINLGPLPGGGASAHISYRATINNPLPAGVTQVSNQGLVTDNDPRTPDEPTDDPKDPDPDDPTDTIIEAKPKIDASKRDTLLVDTDNNGSPSPGDTLLYNITIINSGNQAASGLDYNDNPDANTTLVVGSVATSVGSITKGNSAGDTGITVDIGTLPGGGAEVNISYHATINNPVPAGVTQVSNQGLITSDDPELPDEPTDDPDDPEEKDPTNTFIDAAPHIDVYKEATLLTDADSNGSPSPGDTLLYNITIINDGNQAGTEVFYDDTPDANTSLVVGSVSTSLGSVTLGNSAGNSSVQVNISTLPGGDSVSISYRVTIDNPLPANVTQVSNQGTTSGSNFPDEPSDDPETPGLPKDPTDVVVVAAPVLSAHKHDSLLIDLDENGFASPGDTLLYNVTVINSGNTAATGVVYNDTPDANTQLVPGTVRTNLGSVTTGNDAGATTVSVDVGQIPSGSQLEISYQVVIDEDLPEDVTELRNQGVIHNDNDIMPCPEEVRSSDSQGSDAVHCPEIPTNDPSTTAQGDPTITPIDRDPTAEEPTEQPQQQRSIFLPRVNQKSEQ